MPMMVKICGITNREDALAAVDAGATAIGFNFHPSSPRCISCDQAAQIGEGLPVTKAGIFVEQTPDAIAGSLRAAGLDVAQVYGLTLYPGLRTWRACRVANELTLPDDPHSEAFLLDAYSSDALGGTGRTFAWRLASGAGRKIILAGGLDGSNVQQAIEEAQPWGVDACSRIESFPGRKDHAKMRRFIRAALECHL